MVDETRSRRSECYCISHAANASSNYLKTDGNSDLSRGLRTRNTYRETCILYMYIRTEQQVRPVIIARHATLPACQTLRCMSSSPSADVHRNLDVHFHRRCRRCCLSVIQPLCFTGTDAYKIPSIHRLPPLTHKPHPRYNHRLGGVYVYVYGRKAWLPHVGPPSACDE